MRRLLDDPSISDITFEFPSENDELDKVGDSMYTSSQLLPPSDHSVNTSGSQANADELSSSTLPVNSQCINHKSGVTTRNSCEETASTSGASDHATNKRRRQQLAQHFEQH